MGNIPSDPKATFNSYLPQSDDGAEKEEKSKVTLLCNVEAELAQINTTIDQLKSKSADEIEKELHALLIDTEKKLRHVNKHSKWHIHNPFKKKEAEMPGNDSNNANVTEENEKLKQEVKDLTIKHNEEMEKFEKQHIEDVKKLKEEEMKNNQLLLRLSKEIGEKLTKDNTAITDLSDSNRPTKLGEIYNELYDNEWTDAYDGLTGAGYESEEAIATLYLTLLNVYDFCKAKAETMLMKTDDAVNYLFEEYKLLQEKNEVHVTKMSKERVSNLISMPTENQPCEDIELRQRWEYKTGHEPGLKKNRVSSMIQRSDKIVDKLKVFQKEVAEIMAPVVQKAYFKASMLDNQCVSELKPFIKKCVFVCWIMVVQSTPMCFHAVDLKEEDKFDKELYREYTSTGTIVKYIVWPAILLHEKGPAVCKGIAQCCKPQTIQSNLDDTSSC